MYEPVMPQLLEAKQYTMMLFGLHLLGAHMLQHYGMTNLVMQHCCHVSVASLGRPDHIFSGADVGPTLAFCNMNCPDRKTASTVQPLQCLKWRGKGNVEKTVLHSAIFPLLLCFHQGPFESLLNHPSLFHEWMDQSQKIKTAIMAHTDTHA